MIGEVASRGPPPSLSSANITRPRTESSLGQPLDFRAASRVSESPRTRSGVRISPSAKTERISASTESSPALIERDRPGRQARRRASSLSSTKTSIGT